MKKLSASRYARRGPSRCTALPTATEEETDATRKTVVFHA
jgi:hypothetical protein